jgi:ubiquinone/menaquinone biosynthesis C-methylase UbiE
MLHLLNRSNVAMNALVLDCLQLESRDRVLEVGFGGGDLIAKMSHVLRRGYITGVDFSQDVVDACAKRFAPLVRIGLLDLHCANIEELPFEPGRFTKACTVNTLYFLPDPLAALRQIHRVLRDNGTLVLGFTPRAWMEGRGKFIHHGFSLYEPEEVSLLLVNAGFRDVQLFYGKNRLGECVAATGKK